MFSGISIFSNIPYIRLKYGIDEKLNLFEGSFDKELKNESDSKIFKLTQRKPD